LLQKNRNSNLAKITISILVDFDKRIAIFDFDFKIVTALAALPVNQHISYL